MPEPQTTISVFSSFLEADRAKTFLQSKGISAILVEEVSSPFVNATDVVHLRVAESDASQALQMLVAEGHVAASGEWHPDFDPPGEGEMTCRCTNCGRTYSTEYDFCPYCEPPADWLAGAIPNRLALTDDSWNAKERTVAGRSRPNAGETRNLLAEWALYSALAGLCFLPLAFASLTLIVILCVAFAGDKMRPESWMSVYISATISAIELGILFLAVWSLWQRFNP